MGHPTLQLGSTTIHWGSSLKSLLLLDAALKRRSSTIAPATVVPASIKPPNPETLLACAALHWKARCVEER